MLLSWLRSLWLGIGGLALGVSIGVLLEAGVLYWLLRRRLPAPAGSPLPGGGSSLLNAAWLAAYVLAGAAFYAGGMFLFGGDEARSAFKRMRARITGANGPGGPLA